MSADPPAESLISRLASQFQGLDPQDPSAWPSAPRHLLLVGVACAVVLGLWFALISDTRDALNQERSLEVGLRADYSRKVPQAFDLQALRRQREQVLQQVDQLEKQLPGRAEMDALLSDINQAGLGRGLHFELFRPGQVTVRAYYAELPIALKVQGRYHDIGAFASDIANLSRIVTLNNIAVVPGRDGALAMEATAKTYRYLDPDEIAAQRKAASGKARP